MDELISGAWKSSPAQRALFLSLKHLEWPDVSAFNKTVGPDEQLMTGAFAKRQGLVISWGCDKQNIDFIHLIYRTASRDLRILERHEHESAFTVLLGHSYATMINFWGKLVLRAEGPAAILTSMARFGWPVSKMQLVEDSIKIPIYVDDYETWLHTYWMYTLGQLCREECIEYFGQVLAHNGYSDWSEHVKSTNLWREIEDRAAKEIGQQKALQVRALG